MLTHGFRNKRGISTVLGTMEFHRRCSLEESTKMTESFRDKGFQELDTAAMYSGGQSEIFLGQMPKSSWREPRMIVATKINPWGKRNLSPEDARRQVNECLNRLKLKSVDILYLHAPDHNTPLLETLTEVNKMKEEGLFNELGLSNYSAWLVSEAVNICKANNFVLPTVYQGMYSAITRQVEGELLPCLRYNNIRFYAYSPLGGGVLTGKWKASDVQTADTQPKSRFFDKGPWAKIYRDRYFKQEYFDGIDALKELIAKRYPESTPTVAEVAYRWIYHHSMLKDNDAVIIGASSYDQMMLNLDLSSKPELDDEIVEFLNEWWKNTAHLCPNYYR